MKILILAIGSRGDVQPYVALGHGLQQMGHEVALCTGNLFQEMVTRYGLAYWLMDDEMIRLADSPEARQMIEGGGNPFKAINLVKPMIRRMAADIWQAAQAVRPDLILYHPKTLGGYHAAEALGVPVILSVVLPMYTPTAEFAVPLTTANLGGFLNRQTYKMVPLISAPYSSVINDFRQELGLKPRGKIINETRLPDGRPTPILYGHSHHVVPRPSDWPDTTQAAGYWFLPPDESWQPPADLEAFLQAGPPPVYVGFGSMAGTQPERLAATAVQALQQSGQRGLLATGWGGLKPGALPDTIFQLESAPHDWLFERVTAVVHHGGSGTTAAGLRAGKPSLICPFLGDQPFWGEQVHRLGAGPKPIRQKQLTVDKLAAAIADMTGNEVMRQRATAVGQALRREDSIANAAQFIAQVMGEKAALQQLGE
ncbi:MAG: glycosyltransferase family 1 protein [Ardenticatenaceae bacterium]|nr:glycosyltransferase family 1 protein [Ardenticatenaceae bacterium]